MEEENLVNESEKNYNWSKPAGRIRDHVIDGEAWYEANGARTAGSDGEWGDMVRGDQV